MRSDDLAPYMVPPGKADLGFRQGTLLAWDPQTGANTVEVGGTKLSNIPTLSASTLALAAGDVVALLRYRSTFFITGRIAAAGAGALAIRSANIGTEESTTSSTKTDLATPGPSVDAYIGASRQCLVIVQASMRILNGVCSAWPVLTGASSLTGSSPAFVGSDTGTVLSSATSTSLITAADGLNPGLNHFKVQYARSSTGTGGSAAYFANRTITVIPF